MKFIIKLDTVSTEESGSPLALRVRLLGFIDAFKEKNYFLSLSLSPHFSFFFSFFLSHIFYLSSLSFSISHSLSLSFFINFTEFSLLFFFPLSNSLFFYEEFVLSLTHWVENPVDDTL